MKKFLIATILFFSTTLTIQAQNIFELISTSQNFFETLEKGNYEEAQGFFDLTAKEKITPESLNSLWSQLKTAYGEYKSVDLVKSSNEGDLFRVIVEVSFSNSSQNILMVYNKSQKLVGIFLAPKTETIEYKLPTYADTTKFSEKEVFIETKQYKLVGKFTYPKNAQNFPVVVLVHGSGPSDMDQTVGPNKSFKDISAGLATQGVATIRYVKRSMIYDLNGAITVKEETIEDALTALALAKKMQGVNPKKVYLYGHSLGGMLAPRIASSVPDLAGLIIAAGPARTLTDVILDQNKYFLNLSKDTTVNSNERFDEIVKFLEPSKIKTLGNIKPDSLLVGLPASYWVDLNSMNQINLLKGMPKPRVFVAQGGMDFQVSETDFNLWQKTITGRKNATAKLYPDLDHFFMPQKEKGTPQQYQVPGNVSEQYIKDLANWILEK
ncbi:alpha/beta fold hydrolase [Pedobacter flavus]|uniref:Alpha/beta fold hydrolase n=1 Tax=Pedobacter flavus TaxID=3113906 RepID=A0ABU7H0S7_9SPHI|nr:alpha/beta fold hydrolase [Pedobacter sp. VNH31]MEE1884131.1 alpha/beta fold hydrolase [Pedobacter sp. VNH31]